jgi:hypothetical protein
MWWFERAVRPAAVLRASCRPRACYRPVAHPTFWFSGFGSLALSAIVSGRHFLPMTHPVIYLILLPLVCPLSGSQSEGRVACHASDFRRHPNRQCSTVLLSLNAHSSGHFLDMSARPFRAFFLLGTFGGGGARGGARAERELERPRGAPCVDLVLNIVYRPLVHRVAHPPRPSFRVFTF